jgi:hypothetical protein
MTELSELGKSKMKCRFCEGTGMNDWEKQKQITLFGKTADQILKIIGFAEEHGYEEDTRNDNE